MRLVDKVFLIGLMAVFSWCMCDAQGQPPSGSIAPDPSSPYRVVWSIRPYDVDVLLLQYRGEGQEASEDSADILRKAKQATGCERVVAYPDSFIPVLISKDRVAEVQQLLGNQMLPLTPGLEWSPGSNTATQGDY